MVYHTYIPYILYIPYIPYPYGPYMLSHVHLCVHIWRYNPWLEWRSEKQSVQVPGIDEKPAPLSLGQETLFFLGPGAGFWGLPWVYHMTHAERKWSQREYQTWTGWSFGTWILFFHMNWEFHHPNWRTHIFQRGRAQPPTREHIFWPPNRQSFRLEFFHHHPTGWVETHSLISCYTIW